MSACGKKIELYHGLPERDANEVIASLQRRGMESTKVQSKQGYAVSVSEPDLPAAVSVLQQEGLPRGTYARMGEVFRKEGMISTPAEEKGRYLFALSQELESTLSQIDGVLLARVHPVLQERLTPGEPVLPASCAVLIKYRSGWDPEAYEDRIRRLVMAGIPGLSNPGPERVTIAFVPASEEEELAAAAERRLQSQARPEAPHQWLAGRGMLWLLGLATVVAGGSGGCIAWLYRRRRLEEGSIRYAPDIESVQSETAGSRLHNSA